MYIYTLTFQVISSIKFFNASDDLRNRFHHLDSFFIILHKWGKKAFFFCQGENLDALDSIKSPKLVIEL